MRKKPLIETNPHLRDAEKRRARVITSVATSTSIETGEKPETIARKLKRHARLASVKSRPGPAR